MREVRASILGETARRRNCATFRDADLEGADFCGADLRGADLRGGALTEASFFGADAQSGAIASARFDASTRVDDAGLEAMTDEQAEFVRAAVRG